jgi:hypothetical protein
VRTNSAPWHLPTMLEGMKYEQPLSKGHWVRKTSVRLACQPEALFEGVYDFLSVLAAHGRDEPAGRVIVLNSVNMVRRAIEAIQADSISSLACYFDHDLAGEMAFAELRREVELSRERSIVVRDDSALYSGYKDVNEWWIATALRDRPNDRSSQVRGVF